jgi:hypothetical protein
MQFAGNCKFDRYRIKIVTGTKNPPSFTTGPCIARLFHISGTGQWSILRSAREDCPHRTECGRNTLSLGGHLPQPRL